MTITVQCPSCATSFPVDPAKVPEGGVHARCSHCSSVFFVARPPQIEDAAAEPTPDEVRGPVEPEPEPTPDEVRGPVEPEPEAASPAEESPAGAVEEPDEWVFEREPEVDPSTLDVQPMETVENSQEGYFSETDDIETDEPEIGVEGGAGDLAAPRGEWDAGGSPPPEEGFFLGGDPTGGTAAPIQEEPAAPEEAPSPQEGQVPESVPSPETPPAGFQFGRRDPHEKAQRLARVLVSDMIMYNPERHTRALEGGSLPQDFDDEIKKSWEEYVDQVGDEIARSTPYFSDALNDILAKGDEIFKGSPPTS